ncbi:MAG: ferritin-like domain-containing protein [Sciscionella sp.]
MSNTEIFDGNPVVVFDRESDRRNFLRWAGLVGVGTGFVLGGAVVTQPSHASSLTMQAAAGSSDVDILNYALTLEYLESDFYTQGLQAGILSGRELDLVKPIESHEQAHVKAVMDAVSKLGGKPVAKPKLMFPDGTFKSKDKFLSTASTFEELGVTAYQGQVTHIKSGDILAAAASIAGVESRHAAILAQLTGGKPFPAPFEANKTMAQVLPKVKPYLS